MEKIIFRFMENVVFKFEPLLSGSLVRRINRFVSLVEIHDIDGGTSEVECYMANPGSMLGMCVKGADVRLSKSPNSTRKFVYTVEAVKINRTWIGCNTHLANAIGRNILQDRSICERIRLGRFDAFKAEVKQGDCRFDFELSKSDSPRKILMEIKTVTMASDWFEIEQQDRADKRPKGFPDSVPDECQVAAVALFPDCRSERALKHVEGLARAIEPGSSESLLVFMVMRDDVNSVSPSVFCDPCYATGLADAVRKGVRVIGLKFKFDVSDLRNARVVLVGMVPFLQPAVLRRSEEIPKKRRKS
jgi:DNA-binding sugar fermentation-stimulating protein